MTSDIKQKTIEQLSDLLRTKSIIFNRYYNGSFDMPIKHDRLSTYYENNFMKSPTLGQYLYWPELDTRLKAFPQNKKAYFGIEDSR
jgi:hypothetical protein